MVNYLFSLHMLKRLRQIGVTLLLMVLIALTAVNVFVFMNRAEIKRALLEQVNQQLKTEIKTQQSLSIRPFQNFPYLAVTLPGVKVESLFPEAPEHLVVAQRVHLLLNYQSIIQGKYKVKKVIIDEGLIDLFVNAEGQQNFNVLKQQQGTDTSFMLILDKVLLRNTTLIYRDKRNTVQDTLPAHHYRFDMKKLRLSGVFRKGEYNLSIKGKTTAQQLLINRIDYLSQKKVDLNAKLTVLNDSIYKFTNADITISKVPFLLKGQLRDEDGYTFLDLNVSGEKLPFRRVSTIIPDTFRKAVASYTGQGKLNLATEIKGKMGPKYNPSVKIEFNSEIKRSC